MSPESRSLLGLPPLTAGSFAAAERRLAALLRTAGDVVITQGGVPLALEAAIRGAARPGSTVLNVVTGPRGLTLGAWLRDAGATVVDLAVPFDRAVTAGEVAEALERHPAVDLVSLVHADAATGTANPVPEIGPLVREHGGLLMLDAEASVAAQPLLPDAWAVDLCVVGARKALGGPAGVSAVAVGERAWQRLEGNPAAPRNSYLSLLDWKARWIDPGRASLPYAPAQLEMLALDACLDRVDADGLERVTDRHRLAAARTREGVLDLGLAPYVLDARDAAPVVTTVRTPLGMDAAELAAFALTVDPAAPLSPGSGALAADMLRVDHYGPAAGSAAVDRALAALSAALHR